MGNILYKYAWNHRSDNKFINLSVTVCRRERRTSFFCNVTHLVQKVVSIKSNFVVVSQTIITTSNSNFASLSAEILKRFWPFALIL